MASRNRLVLRQMPQETCAVLKQMLMQGLTWNAFGMDFDALFLRGNASERNASATIELIDREIIPWYYGACRDCRAIMRMDLQNRWRSRSRPTHPAALNFLPASASQRFRRDGFLRLAKFGVDVDALARQAAAHLAGAGDAKVTSRGVRLEGMDPILKNQEIVDLASYYLGSSAVMTGYKILRVGSHVSRKGYLSGYWHHDSCGTRLKLFVFLQDVEEAGAPTEIAVGSQGTLHFGFGPALSRYDDARVAGAYRTEKMTGPQGSGFIFDTNAVHRGNVDGAHLARDAVVVEFSASNKLLNHVPPHGPCPEPSTFKPEGSQG